MKTKFVVLVSILMVLCSTVAFADDDSDFKVTIGLKAWDNSWKHTRDNFGGGTQSWNNGSSLMVGPSVNFRFDKGFLGVSYLQSTSNYKAPDWFTATDTMEFKRTDLDLTLGVMFTNHFGAFIGYKSIDAKMQYINAALGADKLDSGSWTLKGPGIGLLGNVSVGDAGALYGNMAWMRVKSQFDYTSDLIATTYSVSGTVEQVDLTGFSLELGFAYAFSQHLSSNLGYKYQTFTGDNEFGDTETHTFNGVTLGLSLTF